MFRLSFGVRADSYEWFNARAGLANIISVLVPGVELPSWIPWGYLDGPAR